MALLLAAALLTACAGTPRPDTGGAPEPGQAPGTSQETAGVDWEELSLDQVPDEVRTWVEQQQGQIGIFQEIREDRTYILVAWGEKPTGGYEIAVDDVAAAGDEALRLEITLTAPEDNAVVTQVVTHPFALIAVEPAALYRIEPQFAGARFLENRAFRVDEPALFTEVSDSVRVAGEARVFEGVFHISVEDGHNVLAEQMMQVEGAPAWAPFEVDLEWTQTPTSPNGVVFVYTHSPEDGSIIDAIAVPIRFAEWE
ncbi:MAG TPA: Gmad2 immunoglobulin-like domain-containing protein [Bacillota bacterium]